MKTLKKHLFGLILIIIMVNCCQSQNLEFGSELRAKIKAKLDSLYPHATGNVVIFRNDKFVSGANQEMQINCHCDESDGMITLVFDTNGNLLNKEVEYTSFKNLPDTIVSYMKKNASPTVKFSNGYMKYTNKQGEISYGITVEESPHPWILSEYFLKFKSSGELISKEAIPLAKQ